MNFRIIPLLSSIIFVSVCGMDIDTSDDKTAITVKIGQETYPIPEKILPYIKTFQESRDMGIDRSTFKDISGLFPNPIDSALFHDLLNILHNYETYKHNDQMRDFSIKKDVLNYIMPTDTITTPLTAIVRFLNLINFLAVEILLEPCIDTIVSLLKDGKLNPADRAWQQLNPILEEEIQSRLSDFCVEMLKVITMDTMDTIDKKVMFKDVDGDVIFSHNGKYACWGPPAHTKIITFANLYTLKIICSHTFDFDIIEYTLSDDGSLIALQTQQNHRDQIIIFSVEELIEQNTSVPNTIQLPQGQEIEKFALSPDNKKICIATKQNRIYIFGKDNNFTTKVGEFDLQNSQINGNYDYHIHWFPDSQKCVLSLWNIDNNDNNPILVIEIGNSSVQNIHRITNANNKFVVVIPLNDTQILCMENNRTPYIITLNTIGTVTKSTRKKIGIHILERPTDALASNNGNYVLIYSDNSVDILDLKTGHIIKTFNGIFHGNFSTHDTGIWGYYHDSTIVFYSFTDPNSDVENILRTLNFKQLTFIASILENIRNNTQDSSQFESLETILLQLNVNPKNIQALKKFIHKAQRFYAKEIFQDKGSSSDEDSSSDNDISNNNFMEVNPRPQPAEITQAAQPPIVAPNQLPAGIPVVPQFQPLAQPQEQSIIDTLPMDTDDQSDIFPELEKFYKQ